MNMIARMDHNTLSLKRSPGSRRSDFRWIFSGRGPVRGFQIEALTQRSLLLSGYSKRAA